MRITIVATEAHRRPAEIDPVSRGRGRLRLNQASLEAAQAQARLGNWQYDPAADQAVWSKEMFHLLGRDPALGQPTSAEFLELVHPEDRKSLIDTQHLSPDMGDECEAHIRTNPALGPVRYLHMIARAVRDRAGTLRYLAGTLQDETNRRLTETVILESEARYRGLFEHNPAPMLIYERGTFQMLAVNEAFSRKYGYTQEEALEMRLTDLYVGEEKERIARLIPNLHGYANVGEWHHRRRDGSLMTIEATSHDIEFDGRNARVAVMTDITDRKRVENAMRDLNGVLEQRVRERTEELAEARDRAEAADRLKSAFLATMSHELRTPLNSIIGFTGIILQGLAGPLNPEQAKQLNMVRASARHLLSLINDVLDISKIEAGQLEITLAPFDVRASVERVVELVRPLADKKALPIRASIGPGVGRAVGDQRRVEQVLLNLLNNAVKFTETGEVALVADLVDGDEAARLRFEIRDTGIGIAPGDIATLFQPFRQIDTGLTRQHEGTGLGLAICRRLVRLMAGKIHVESEAGKGSVFTVILPVDLTYLEPSSPPSRSPFSGPSAPVP